MAAVELQCAHILPLNTCTTTCDIMGCLRAHAHGGMVVMLPRHNEDGLLLWVAVGSASLQAMLRC